MRKFLLCLFSGVCVVCLFCGAAIGVSAGSEKSKKAEDFFSATKNAEIITDYQAPEHIGNYKGIFVKASMNGESTVTLNHELDLRMFTADDILIQLIPVTTKPIQTKNKLQVSAITVRLTDAEDDDIYVEMTMKANPDAAYPYGGYADANGNGQIPTGWNYDKFNATNQITYFSNSAFGRNVNANFYGRARDGHTIKDEIKPFSFYV